MSAADDPLPFISLCVAPFLTDTQCLTVEELGTLVRLLLHAWRRGATLPNDIPALSRLVNLGADELRCLLPALSPWLQKQDADGSTPTLRVPMLEHELRRSLELREKKRRSARKLNERLGRGTTLTVTDNVTDNVSESETHIDADTETWSSTIASRPHPHPHPHPHPDPNPRTHTTGGGEGSARETARARREGNGSTGYGAKAQRIRQLLAEGKSEVEIISLGVASSSEVYRVAEIRRRNHS